MDWYLTDSKSRIARVIHVVKKNVFRDNKGENIRVESELLCHCGTILQHSVNFKSVSPGFTEFLE